MLALLIKLVTGNYGRIKVALTASAVWLASWLITRFGLNLDAATAVQINATVTAAVGWGLEAFGAALGVKSIKSIQNAVPQQVTEDGHAGPETMLAIRNLVWKASVKKVDG